VKPPLSIGVTLGSSASNRSWAVSHTRVGRVPQPTATNRPSGCAPLTMPQSSPVGSALHRRYGECAARQGPRSASLARCPRRWRCHRRARRGVPPRSGRTRPRRSCSGAD
jgi:hypothetical protein